MTDATEEAREKQFEIFFLKTPKDRFRIAAEMIDFMKQVVENSIRSENPGISKADLAAAVFKRYYVNDFPPAELEKIAEQIRQYHLSELWFGMI